jgi:hypothetical protein
MLLASMSYKTSVGIFIVISLSNCRVIQDLEHVQRLASVAKDARESLHVVYLQPACFSETELSDEVLYHISRNKTVVVEKYGKIGGVDKEFDAKYLEREFLLEPQVRITVQGKFLRVKDLHHLIVIERRGETSQKLDRTIYSGVG